jgi:signal transduction histidine kinase
MAEGSGRVGKQLKEKGHRLKAGQGIVGTVASTNEAFLSNNVDELLNFVRNRLLPDTRAELAVPLRTGEKVVGVLDIQSEEVNRFSPADVSLMQSIANQTAIAVDNANLLAETQAALREVERLNLQLTGEAWEAFTAELPTVGYRYRSGVSTPLMPDSNGWLRPMKQAAAGKQLVKEFHPGNGQPPRAELAVPLILRGQVIGTLGIKREEVVDWSEDEMSAVESVANQISLALENARLSEEQAKTIVQLKDVDRLKSEFLTSMSHELRTPLNSIIGFADVIIQGIDGEIPDMAMSDVKMIHNSGQHLLALINDILDLAKIEAGEMGLVQEPLAVADAFNEVISASSSLVKDKPVEIIVDADESLPPIYADRLRFNQIMLNLVSNAVKFTDEGSVTLKAEVKDEDPDKMFIAVTDTGIGISADKIDSVFDRFRQADSSTTRKYGGTGLGLPICQQLVEMHGGELGLISEEGQGSTFYFTIPLTGESVTDEG